MTLKNNQTNGRRLRRVGILGGVAALALSAGTAMTAAPANAATAAPTNTWDKLAQCESGGNWGINTGNGFKGGLQFTNSTWKAYGGKGSANNASKAEQIRVAKKVQAGQGWGAWPACSAKLGLSGKSGVGAGVTSSGTNTKGSSATSYTKKSTSTSTAKRYSSAKKYTGTTQYSAAKKSTVSTATNRAAGTYKSAKSYAAPAKSYVAPTKSYSSTTRVAKHVAPSVALPANVKDSGKNYTVKSGDTLFKIAQSQGLDSWTSLYALNKGSVSDPNMIFVGETLNLPTK